MQLELEMTDDSSVNLILANKQQYITKNCLHLEYYLHIKIHGQVLLSNRYIWKKQTL